MTREEMLAALQADVNGWPRAVKDAGVTNAAGSAYVPLPRNNEILKDVARSSGYACLHDSRLGPTLMPTGAVDRTGGTGCGRRRLVPSSLGSG